MLASNQDFDVSSESSTSEEEERPCFRYAQLYCSYCKEKYDKFTIRTLKEMSVMGLLSFWHCIGLWLGSCVLMCEVLQKLLKGYVEWMELVMNDDGASSFDGSLFLATLLRAWFTVNVYADLIRFCFSLAWDAWRADAFEAYRRAVCGLGGVEMKSGCLFEDEQGLQAGWPEEGLDPVRRVIDVCVQLAIFLSWDVYPAYHAYLTSTEELTIRIFLSTLARKGALAAVVHAIVFKFAWMCTDLWLKYQGFMEAMSQEGEFDEAYCGEARPLALSSAREVPLDAEAMSTSPAALTDMHERLGEHRDCAGEQAADFKLRRQLEVASELNLWVKFCSFTRLIGPHLLWIAVLLLGIIFQKILLVVLSLLFAVYHFARSALILAAKGNFVPAAEAVLASCRRERTRSRRVWALEAWGDECCGLHVDVQANRRLVFVVMVSLQAVLFAILGWPLYTACCVVLVALQLSQLTVRFQAPWTWLVGLIEAALSFVITTLLAAFCLPKRRRVLETVLFILAHQCGLSRRSWYGIHGSKVVRALFLVLFSALVIVLAATTKAASTKNESDIFTMINRSQTFYEVPYVPQHVATGLACPLWFHLGTREVKFSLSDFGLFSAIAYESEATTLSTLQHFFPGWSVVYSKRDMVQGDWTTFHEFVYGNTTVFAVRGTSTALDALNDMIIWMPAAVMMAFNVLGPDLFSPVAQAIKNLGKVLGNIDNTNYEVLERHVISKMKAEPRREYFITGHSLGGGLAKIVAMHALVQGLELPAITFMSPGLMATQYLVVENPFQGASRGNQYDSFIRDHLQVLTVMPENDIVSRIDSQSGQVVPIGCPAGDPLHCHTIGTGLCQIFEDCGSGRRGESVRIPCDLCAGAPCIPGVGAKQFRVQRRHGGLGNLLQRGR